MQATTAWGDIILPPRGHPPDIDPITIMFINHGPGFLIVESQASVWVLFVLLLGGALAGCLGIGDKPAEDDKEENGSSQNGADDDNGGDDAENGSTGGHDEDGGDENGDPDGNGNGGSGEDGSNGDDGGDEDGAGYYDPGWPEIAEAQIRPGVRVTSSLGICTSNFVFASPDNRTLYLGLASHCVGESAINDTVDIAGIDDAGVIVYCSWMFTEGEADCPASEDNTILDVNDFALIRIKDEHRDKVHPALLHWGGPLSVAPPPATFTHALAYGNTPTSPSQQFSPMEGVVTPFVSGSMGSYIYFLRPGILGDSGSAVISADGHALGVLVGIASAPPGSNLVTNLQPALEYMHAQTGLEVELKAWRMISDPLLP
jgi:hypothetical protein